MGTISVNGKNILRLIFSWQKSEFYRVFTWGLANDLHICKKKEKKKEKPAKHILTWSKK